jgi:hypothetical protein
VASIMLIEPLLGRFFEVYRGLTLKEAALVLDICWGCGGLVDIFRRHVCAAAGAGGS